MECNMSVMRTEKKIAMSLVLTLAVVITTPVGNVSADEEDKEKASAQQLKEVQELVKTELNKRNDAALDHGCRNTDHYSHGHSLNGISSPYANTT